MKAAVYQFVTDLSNRLPDLRRVSTKRQAAMGLLFSILFHLVLLSVAALVGLLLPEWIQDLPLPEPEPARTIEIELVPVPPAPAPPSAPPQEPRLVAIQADGLTEAAQAPEKPIFESSQNMVAGSEKPGAGTVPLPSQEGADLPFQQFKNQKASLSQDPAAAAAREKAMEQQPVKPEKEVPEKDPKEAKQAVEKAPPPEPLLMAKNSTVPIPAAELPEPVAPPKPAVLPKPAEEMAGDPGTQPELRQTRIDGSISNRGRPGVDAVKTPMGVYREKIRMQIHSRWLREVEEKKSTCTPGLVRVAFYVAREGRIEGVRVLENTSNGGFGDICEYAVRAAKLPPPPPDVELMKDERLEMVFSFYLY